MADHRGAAHLEVLRTEREVAADAVISLFEEGLLTLNDPHIVARAARAAGLTPSDLRDAHRRWLTGRWRPPAALPVADQSDAVPPNRTEEERELLALGQMVFVLTLLTVAVFLALMAT